MKLTNELLKKAKKCNSIEEFSALTKKEGFNLNEESIKFIYKSLPSYGELNEDELASVSSGCASFDKVNNTSYCSGALPKFNLNQNVIYNGEIYKISKVYPTKEFYSEGMYEGNMFFYDLINKELKYQCLTKIPEAYLKKLN